MTSWLEDFAYSVELSWWIFILAGITAIALTFVTISVQAIMTALENPAKNLRAE
jgi:putative ABC transport system permease protein